MTIKDRPKTELWFNWIVNPVLSTLKLCFRGSHYICGKDKNYGPMIGVLQCDRYYRYAGPPHEVEGLKNCRAALLDTQTHVAFIIIPPRSAVELIYNMPSSHCPESWWWIYQKRNWRWLLFVPWSPFPCYYSQPCQSARWFGCEHAQEISGLSCAISGPKSIKCIDSIRASSAPGTGLFIHPSI